MKIKSSSNNYLIPLLGILMMMSGPALERAQAKTFHQMTAIVQIGGDPLPPDFETCKATALDFISPVSKIGIVQGVAGRNADTKSPDLFFQKDQPAPAPDLNSTLTVSLLTRYQTLQQTEPGAVSTTSITGQVEYLPFAFALDPSLMQERGTLYYKIIVKRLDSGGNVLGSTTCSSGSSDAWKSVDVGAVGQAPDLIGNSGGRVVIQDGNPNDGLTSVDIPAHMFSQPTQVNITQIPSSVIPAATSIPNAVTTYLLEPSQPLTGPVRVSLLYPDFTYPESKGIQGQDGIVDGTNVPENKISVAWWDGFEWRNLGGRVDPANNIISLRVKSSGYYAVIAAAPPTGKATRPAEKVITPNNDGRNDKAIFSLGGTSTTVEIYDVTGHRIRSLSSPNNTEWDGRDENGNIVESGVYIYQYTADGEHVSGVIAVAK